MTVNNRQRWAQQCRYEAWWCFIFSCNALVHTLLRTTINAVRFSDGLGLQNRSRYEAGCCQFTAMVGTLQQLQIVRKIGKRSDGITGVRKWRKTTFCCFGNWLHCFLLVFLGFYLCSRLGEIHFLLAWSSQVHCQVHVVFKLFISKGGIPHCGDGWLVPLERSFEGHSPSVAATVRTSKIFNHVLNCCHSEKQPLNACASLGALVIYLQLIAGIPGRYFSHSLRAIGTRGTGEKHYHDC